MVGRRVAWLAAEDALFGETARKMGIVTKGELYDALTLQRQKQVRGQEVPRLGAALVEMGVMTSEQVAHVLEEQARE